MNPLDFAVEVAQEAGNILMQYFGQELNRTIKYNIEDYATEADYAAEKYILSRIKEEFPNDAIVAEESGSHEKEGAEYTWIIDPLDGTKNFATGKEYFGVLIARCKGNEVQLAVAYSPISKSVAIATKGEGTFLNGRKINLSNKPELDKKILAANSDLYDILKPEFESKTRLSAISTTLYCLEGEHGAYISNAGFVWDFAGPGLLMAEAGWRMTTFGNKSYTWDGTIAYGWPGLVAASPAMHSKIMDLLRKSSL